MPEYQQCKFDENSFLSVPEIGDSFITSVVILLEEHKLKLTTNYKMAKDSEFRTEILFSGVQAHHFDHISDPSIIFGIEESDIEYVHDIWEHIFIDGKNHGWPIDHDDKEDMIIKLHKNKIRCYKVYGSCGLDGFVLATGISYKALKK